jgi:hypothetical protein
MVNWKKEQNKTEATHVEQAFVCQQQTSAAKERQSLKKDTSARGSNCKPFIYKRRLHEVKEAHRDNHNVHTMINNTAEILTEVPNWKVS